MKIWLQTNCLHKCTCLWLCYRRSDGSCLENWSFWSVAVCSFNFVIGFTAGFQSICFLTSETSRRTHVNTRGRQEIPESLKYFSWSIFLSCWTVTSFDVFKCIMIYIFLKVAHINLIYIWVYSTIIWNSDKFSELKYLAISLTSKCIRFSV